MAKILVVEDDPGILEFLISNLPYRGFAVDGAETGARALSLLAINEYDIALVDLNLPDMTGEAILTHIRRHRPGMPVMILTVVADTRDKVRLLNLGADDYLSKPFSFEELLARLSALLRRGAGPVTEIAKVGPFSIDFNNQSVKKKGKEVTLTKKEFAILEYLIRRRGSLVRKTELLEHLWDSQANLFLTSLETHVANLRRKLNTPGFIHTVHGRGYMIKEYN